MKMKRCIALILTLAMALSCVAISASAVSIEDNTNTENNQVSTAAIDYGTVTQNSDGSVMLNFGQDSITVKGNRGDIVTDSEHGGILRPDNLRTNDDSIAILTLPSVNLKNSGYDKLDLYVASEKNAAVVVKAGDTEIALTDLSSAYSDLSGMSAEKILDTAAKSTGDAAISVTVKWEDDTETTVSFTVYDSSFHLAEINGEARKLVNKRDVEKLVEDMTALLKK